MNFSAQSNKKKFSFRQPDDTASQFRQFTQTTPQFRNVAFDTPPAYTPTTSRIIQQPHYVSTKSKQYVPLGYVLQHAVLKKKQLKYLNFQQIHLQQQNQSSLNKIIFKSNVDSKQITFYLPTFVRFNLIKLHSQDLKHITHIQNKNNLIVYINVYVKGLPALFIQKLSKKVHNAQGVQEAPEIAFKANNNLFYANYYTSQGDYLIFLFNSFSQRKVEFEILKNVVYAPFEQAELILNIHINKKIFKLQANKSIKINHSNPLIQSSQSILEFQFNKVVIQFKLEEPIDITDSFRYHKSIQHGNYGLMTNEVHIQLGSSKDLQKNQDQQKQSLKKHQENNEELVQNISNIRLSIGLYRYPIAQICTFFLPLMLAAGITLLLFLMCDHDLQNELEVLAIVLVAYGSFIPQFRQRISLSRNVIALDFFILYNSIPAILCAWQSALESRSDGQYNIFHVISSILYLISSLFLVQVYSCFRYIQFNYFIKYRSAMVRNFDSSIFQANQCKFKDNLKLCLNNFKHSQRDRAYFCFKQESKTKLRRKTKKLTLFESNISIIDEQEQLEEITLQIKKSESIDKKIHEIKIQDDQMQINMQNKESLYKVKAIQGENHIHTFNKLMTPKIFLILFMILLVSLLLSVWLSSDWLRTIYKFKDQNGNCIDDQQQKYRQKVINYIDAQIKSSQTTKQKQIIAMSWHHHSLRRNKIHKKQQVSQNVKVNVDVNGKQQNQNQNQSLQQNGATDNNKLIES